MMRGIIAARLLLHHTSNQTGFQRKSDDNVPHFVRGLAGPFDQAEAFSVVIEL
jgi:hypothetical protein